MPFDLPQSLKADLIRLGIAVLAAAAAPPGSCFARAMHAAAVRILEDLWHTPEAADLVASILEHRARAGQLAPAPPSGR